ncbi:protein CFAP20DC isoform X5 [Balearica regulorum gibbericeps]|uniref:protein CFAP20DC isoform X5 n=1 Tax=Balearica regulorum gibbericeps TaxID=100784 RepID=UPI003F63C0E3
MVPALPPPPGKLWVRPSAGVGSSPATLAQCGLYVSFLIEKLKFFFACESWKMFKNQYQGGPFVEIFSAQGKNPGAKWKIFGNPSAIWKEYDKDVKGFVFVLEGSSQINKMQLPKETRQTLGLIQQFLTLQIFVPLGEDFSTELLITDLGNIKRRLYLSTVHKELSVTPLHAKIPLFMIKRRIWCNMCIDLVAFTREIFRGAVFQSLDGISISANCKLRKIFTLKSKPQDTAQEDDPRVVPFMSHEPTGVIPRTCQLNTDVPQVTQLLNLTKIHKPEIKCRRYSGTVQETGSLANRGQGNIHSSKTQDVSHIAFGSKILGPPPSSNRRVSTRISGEVTKTWRRKSNRSCQLQSSERGTESAQDIERLELSFSPCNDQGGKRNTHQAAKDVCENDPAIQTQKTSESGRADFQLASPQEPSADKNSHRKLSLKNAAKATWEIASDEWVFPESFPETIQLDRSEQFVATEHPACHNLTSPQNVSVEHHSAETGDHQVSNKEIFTFSSRPRSAPHGKSPNMSPECCIFPLDLKQDSNGVHGKNQIEDNFQGTDSSEEEYDRKNYRSDRLSSSELQMLASMKRQQNEELRDTGISHGLSASQIDNCNVSISTSSDDTATWNSCFPPPVSQEHHYQKEMSPLSHSNPRDWLNVFSPPIIPGSQQLEEHTKSSTNQSIPGEDDLSAEDDDEVLTLLYDPCLNCYFDPNSGKYYELA